jgi:ribose transport system ATP-binding protein
MRSAPGPDAPVVLSLAGISKRFGAVQALRNVSVDCRAGEVHAVVGENGSGKSTLLGVASGVVAPDEGVIEIGGHRLQAAHTAEALRLGLAMAYQTYSEILDLTVAENLFPVVPASERPSRHRQMRTWAARRLAEFEVEVPVDVRIGDLPLAERQFLEVIKALLVKPKILLLDEPTTALGSEEVERLHALVLNRANQGVGIVYVGHRLPEVLAIADRVTVLRDGHGQGTYEAAGMSEHDLVALMIGRPAELAFPSGRRGGRGESLLVVSEFRGRRFGPIDLTVHEGEIIGIAGADGNGQLEFLRALAGVEHATGTVRCNRNRVSLRTPRRALQAGILMLPSERIRESLLPVLGVRANSTLQVLRRFSWMGLVRRRRERSAVQNLIDRLKVRTPSVEQPVRFLSGGNQQKVVLSRTFLITVRVLLADEPTQGVDVPSRFDIYEALSAKADEGVAMIVKSSDPIELSGLCDRVIVISRGRIIDEIEGSELSEERIVAGIVRSSRDSAGTFRGAKVQPAPEDDGDWAVSEPIPPEAQPAPTTNET